MIKNFNSFVIFEKNMKKFIYLSVLISSFLITGCASITGDTVQSVRLDTANSNGELVNGADCKLSNEYGSFSGKSGDIIQIRRSSADLSILCTKNQEKDARGTAISRSNAGIWGNILFGGGIGAIIDHNKGTGYTYPTWIQLIFGKTLRFDRSDEKEGQPVLGTEANNSKNSM